MSNKKPVLRRLGANTSGAPEKINLSVASTIGPDYMGQQTVDVRGHPKDRPGVCSRLPESDPSDPRIRSMDTGEELPVLLTSNMRADPCEGVQGSYTEIIEGECVRCGYDRLRVSVHTMYGVSTESCNACGATQDPNRSDEYTMPDTDKQRAQQERKSGVKLTSIINKDVYDMEPNTGYGPYISIVGDNDVTRIQKEDIATIFTALWKNNELSLTGKMSKLEKYRAINEVAESL